MKIRLLSTALLAGLAFSAGAQEFDDRWYLTGSAGFNLQDNDRGTNDAPFARLRPRQVHQPQLVRWTVS